MRPRFFARLPAAALAVALYFSTPVAAQSIQRCVGAGGAITYATECPSGTRAVKSLSAAPQPTPEAQEAARKQIQRDKTATRAVDDRLQQQQAQLAAKDAERRAANCGYLRAEIDSVRRMKNVLTTRPYYSLDDVEQMDKHAASLSVDYQRHCG